MVPKEVVLFLTLEVVLFLVLERLKRGTETNSPAYTCMYVCMYVCIYIYAVKLKTGPRFGVL